jgi:phosphatidylserine/phosphatidylglycerophosphate/cardiolipin synthase-like enzyme
MRVREQQSDLTVGVVAVTHVVFMGFDLATEKRVGCLGFAVQREDHGDSERVWMRGIKTFEVVEPDPDPGVMVPSNRHPFQTFQWADYSAKPGTKCTYTVVPLYGDPAAPVQGDSVTVAIRSELELDGKHSVFFNRGAVASQEYARRFQQRRPSEVGDQAYRWLSRGLEEALLAFVRRAQGEEFELYGAVYELEYPSVILALRTAEKSGARVRVIFDAIPGNGPAEENWEHITEGKIKSLVVPRTEGTLMHNKFFVLCRDKAPIAVWTGSTNLTENGIFGHSNCGHIVEDPDVAQRYLDYWNVLRNDPSPGEMKAWNEANSPAPPPPSDADTTVVFSPRDSLAALDWYAGLAGSAQRGLFMTFAFGMHPAFQKVYDQTDGVLRFALMEKEGNGRQLEAGRKAIRRIRSRPNIVVAVGNNVLLNVFDRWLNEIDRVHSDVNVRWVHTKYMLVDPLSENPVVVTGSANFSAASTQRNDENMLVIRGDTRIADIYFSEFMRLHSHYAFREAVGIAREKGELESAEGWKPTYLVPGDDWQRDYFQAGHSRCMRREYFVQ